MGKYFKLVFGGLGVLAFPTFFALLGHFCGPNWWTPLVVMGSLVALVCVVIGGVRLIASALD